MSQKLRYRSIQFKLLFWVTVSFVVPFLVVAIFWNDYLSKNLIANQSFENEQHLKQTAKHISTELFSAPNSLLKLAEGDAELLNIGPGDIRNYTKSLSAADKTASAKEAELSKLFERIRVNFDNVHFVFLGLDDGSYIEYPAFKPKKTYDPRTRPWYVNTLKAGGLFVSEAYRTSETNDMVISFTKSVTLSSGQRGVLGITMNINQLAAELNDYSMVNKGKIMLLNARNQILVSPLNPKWTLQSLENVGQSELLTDSSKKFEPYHYQGDYFRQIYVEPESGLKFIALYPKAEVLALSKTLVNTNTLLIVSLWLIVVLLSRWILKKFTTPLVQLAGLIEAADRPEFKYSGEIETTVSRKDEIGLIAQSVLDLILALRQIVDHDHLIHAVSSHEPLGRDSAKQLYLQSRQILLANEKRLQMAFDLLNDGLWEYHPAHKSFYINEKLKTISPQMATLSTPDPKVLYDQIDPASRPAYVHAVAQLASGQETYYETELLLKDAFGTKRWQLARIQAVTQADQSLLLIGTFSDIHDTKEAEASLKNINAILEVKINERTQDLLAMNEELTAMNEEVLETNAALKETQEHLMRTEKLASLSILVSGVAHEINTPLGNSITASSYLQKLYADLSQQYEANRLTKSSLQNYLSEVKEALTLLENNLERSADLILTFRSIAGDNTNEQPRIFYLEEITQEVLTALRPKFKEVPLELDIQISELLFMKAYPGEFAQILTNLIMNSITHGYDGQHTLQISIHAQRDDAKIILDYKDNGVGMSEETRLKAFDPFYTTNRGHGGTGLGLYFIHTIVTTHFNGRIECLSQPGAGVHFQIALSDIDTILPNAN